LTLAASESIQPRILTRPEHQLSRRKISPNALKVMYRLNRAGYLAYLVGGGVRDILLGRSPKDFDIATNARPEEIRSLFRNSRVIGRRFRLVHILFRDEVVEVSTFRASPEPPEVPDAWDEAEPGEEAASESEDVVVGEEPCEFGTPAEDAWRRDFTINALFYNVADYSIVDWIGGLDDLAAGVLRVIGEPVRRFEEDPVRMMRALEYAVRLGFTLEPATDAGIRASSGLIVEAAPPRLTYELVEGLQSGSAAGICSAWRAYGIFDAAFPGLAKGWHGVEAVLGEIDRRVEARRRCDESTLLGSLLLPQYTEIERAAAGANGRIDNPALLEGLRDLLAPIGNRMHLANHTLHQMAQGLFTLSKLRRPPERGRQVLKLTRQSYFPVAWAIAEIGVESGLLLREGFAGWQRAMQQIERAGGIDEPTVEAEAPRRRRRRRRRRS
jgi:poly(A) polymerase